MYRKAENNKKWPNGDGLSENERKSKMKEITKVACTFFWLGCKQIFFFGIKNESQGHVVVTFCAKWAKVLTPNGAIKVERGPKEDERVARGHFHDRVGESPARCGHFGTSGSSLARLLSEISQFENC